MLTALRYAEGSGWLPVTDVAEISEIIARPDGLLWAHADIAEVSTDDIARMAGEFGLHALAVEDAVHPRQRPKYESYDTHMFAVMHQLDEVDDQYEASQIACFVGQRWVITLHSGAKRTVEEALRRMGRARKAAEQGASFVMHALLDTIVDDYDGKADELEEEIEDLEERALGDPRATLQSQLYAVKQRVARLRRYSLPGERVLAQVVSPGRLGLTTERTAAHFRDVHDHLLRIIDQIRNIDDLTDAVIDLQRAHRGDILNQAIKRLAGWAAIIAVPTFLASVYGMNFELVPQENDLTSFTIVVGVMVFSGAALFWLFKRRDWI